MKKIRNFIADELSLGTFPAIEILAARHETILFHEASGIPDSELPHVPLKKNALFDLASLTKPLATACVFLSLQQDGKLKLEDSIKHYIPEFQNRYADSISLRHLLSHSSGLPDWIALYEPDFDRSAGWDRLMSIESVGPPDEQTIYSCLGYLLMGEVIRRISGRSLNRVCRERIYQPLNLRTLCFNPDLKRINRQVVPTGYCEYRKKRLFGIVHDENAALFSGEGGNSGLFGTASDIHRLCTVILAGEKSREKNVLSTDMIQWMTSNVNPPGIVPRTIGWDIKAGKADYWSCSHDMPDGSIGHLGFTGISLWMDPCSGLMILILTNRVSLGREKNLERMREFRPELHSLLIDHFL